MITFTFEVNRSFLNYFHRPITIPRGQVSYDNLESAGLCSNDLDILCPDGEKMSGKMVYSRAGYGPYYQIRIDGFQNDPLSRLPKGQQVIVEMQKVQGTVEVRLRL